ncbi:MAG TPA: DNA mismatch repair endonuclease MutL [Thermoanaerobaculia bacterium]|nr:DNA mismatch repair endonuclease MutL [Thermoanaerobaculia bacterium]
MAKIRLLDDRLVSQIAAGEVVERPASVVKELVENALDAGARTIEIALEAGGKRSIRIADDGAGMGRDDVVLAFDRHATSKIAVFEDLERVATLGFRGEALSAIAAVAKVELTSAESDGEAWRVRIEGGRIRAVEPSSRQRGTTLEVRSLFYDVPARRKFLKTTTTELRRSIEVVQGYALARPDIGFELVHDDRTLLRAEADEIGLEGLRGRVGRIFGTRFADRLDDLGPAPLGEGALAYGLIGGRETARGRRIFVFVNGRLLRDRAILALFYRAVRETWKSDDAPALFLSVELEADAVDVNVHPQKSEVRFRDGGFLPRLGEVLRAALAQGRGEEAAPLRQPSWERPPATAWSGLGQVGGRGLAAARREEPPDPWGPPSAEAPAEVRDRAMELGVFPAKLAEARLDPIVGGTVRLSGRGGASRALRLLGQYKGTLLLFEGADGLYLVDQHVAHERVLYERFRRALYEERAPSQRLLVPLLLELAPAERLRLAQSVDELVECGFALAELSGDGAVGVTAIPAALDADAAERVLRELASDGEEASAAPGEHDAGEDAGSAGGCRRTGPLRQRLLSSLAASSACKAAVKMHHPLSAREMEELMEELFACEEPFACPHGRPIVLKMDDRDLERRFGRS